MMHFATGGTGGCHNRGDWAPAPKSRPSNLGVGAGGSWGAETGNVHASRASRCEPVGDKNRSRCGMIGEFS